jgi:hypothetical protein
MPIRNFDIAPSSVWNAQFRIREAQVESIRRLPLNRLDLSLHIPRGELLALRTERARAHFRMGEIVRVQVPNVDAQNLMLGEGMHVELEVRRGRSAARLFAKPGTIIVTRIASR